MITVKVSHSVATVFRIGYAVVIIFMISHYGVSVSRIDYYAVTVFRIGYSVVIIFMISYSGVSVSRIGYSVVIVFRIGYSGVGYRSLHWPMQAYVTRCNTRSLVRQIFHSFACQDVGPSII
jgi:hypothetical protein